jgi:hypothetical protein
MDITPLKHELAQLLKINDLNALNNYDSKIKLLINETNKKIDMLIRLRNDLDDLKNHKINLNDIINNNITISENKIQNNNKIIIINYDEKICFLNNYKIINNKKNEYQINLINIPQNQIIKIKDSLYHLYLHTNKYTLVIEYNDNDTTTPIIGTIVCKKK